MSSDVEKTIEKKKNTKNRMYFMLVLWLSINLIWLTLHQQPSLNQVYTPDTQFNQNHTVEVPNLLSSNKSIPFTLHCNFDFSEEGEGLKSNFTLDFVHLTLSQENSIIHEWGGEIGRDCPSWSTELKPGNYNLHTRIDVDSRMIEGALEYELYVFLNFSIEGYLIANALGLLFVLSEIPRGKNKTKQGKGSRWKPKAWDMDDATKEVEVGLITTTEDEETIVSEDIAKQRKQYEEEVQRDSLNLIPEKVPVEQPDVLKGGDDSILKGELRADERIQRVSDIYDLMEKK